MASGNLQLKAVLAALTEDVTPDEATTFLLSYNSSTDEPKKIKLQTILEGIVGGGAAVSDAAYSSGWNGVTDVAPSKNVVYDAIETKADTSHNHNSVYALISRTINAGTGLSGGGDFSANRTLALDINGLTEETTAADGDFIPIYDLSGTVIRKMSRANFLAGLGGGGASSPLVLTANNATETPLTIVGAGGQSVDLAVFGSRSAFTSNGDYKSNDGQMLLFLGGDLRGGWHPTQGGFIVTPGWQYGFSNNSNFNTIDVALVRAAAGIIKVTDGPMGSSGGGALQFTEMSAPSAPSANNAVIYAEDNGSGKTRLMVRFASGASQQISIEP